MPLALKQKIKLLIIRFFDLKCKSILPIPPNSAKHAFELRKFSNLSNEDDALITATTDEYLAFSVSAYTAAVKL